MNYKEQISEFHKRKGLTGKRLRRAVLNDQIRAKHYYLNDRRTVSVPEDYTLMSMFVWQHSPEGTRYWGVRSI